MWNGIGGDKENSFNAQTAGGRHAKDLTTESLEVGNAWSPKIIMENEWMPGS